MRRNYRFYYYLLAIIVVIVFVFLYNVIKIKDMSLDKIQGVIESNTDLSTLDQGDDKKLKKLYYLNAKDIDSFILYAPKTNMDANEILVVRAKNINDIKMIKEKIDERISKQSNSFKEYRPEEYEIIKNSYMRQEGLNIILIISKDSGKLGEEINKLYK